MKLGIFCAAFFLGWIFGWGNTYHTVSVECKQLGAFYIDKTVYKCEVMK